MSLFDRLVDRGWLDRWRGMDGVLGRAIFRADVRWLQCATPELLEALKVLPDAVEKERHLMGDTLIDAIGGLSDEHIAEVWKRR